MEERKNDDLNDNSFISFIALKQENKQSMHLYIIKDRNIRTVKLKEKKNFLFPLFSSPKESSYIGKGKHMQTNAKTTII